MIKNLLKNNIYAGALAVLLLFALPACNKKEIPSAPAQSVKNAEPPKPQTKPVQPQPSSVKSKPAPVSLFDFSSKKDPFKPFVLIKTNPLPSIEKKQKSALPIHNFDVNQFRMIGVITGARENQAMVVDPNGKGYVLKVGMTIGKNEGKVTAITASGIHVLEQFRDDNGRVRKENIIIAMPRKQ
ncbi:MAG TPA: pilus assembly protein PilP [Stenomitos sp.]